MAANIAALYPSCIEFLARPRPRRTYAAAMDRDDVAKWIRSARKSKGWTQQRLGDEVGVTKANVSHWETGKHDPSFLQLLRIRDLTGYALRDVAADGAWPLPGIPRERITALSPDARERLAAGIMGILAALANAPAPSAQRRKPHRHGRMNGQGHLRLVHVVTHRSIEGYRPPRASVGRAPRLRLVQGGGNT